MPALPPPPVNFQALLNYSENLDTTFDDEAYLPRVGYLMFLINPRTGGFQNYVNLTAATRARFHITRTCSESRRIRNRHRPGRGIIIGWEGNKPLFFLGYSYPQDFGHLLYRASTRSTKWFYRKIRHIEEDD